MYNIAMQEDLQLVFNDMKNKKLPQKFPEHCEMLSRLGDLNDIHARFEFTDNFGFPMFSKGWIEPLAKFIGNNKCLEIMAGTGILSKGLQDEGVRVITTDNYSWKNCKDWFSNVWTEVERLDAIESIRKYGATVKYIICSWPYMNEVATNCLLEMRKVNRSCKMIYIGETSGGCTASDSFFKTAKFIDNGVIDIVNQNYQRWVGIHDRVYLIQ